MSALEAINPSHLANLTLLSSLSLTSDDGSCDVTRSVEADDITDDVISTPVKPAPLESQSSKKSLLKRQAVVDVDDVTGMLSC